MLPLPVIERPGPCCTECTAYSMVDVMMCIELSGSVKEEEDFLTRYCSLSRRVLLRAVYVLADVRKDTPPPDIWEEGDRQHVLLCRLPSTASTTTGPFPPVCEFSS